MANWEVGQRVGTSRPINATAARVVQPGPKGLESRKRQSGTQSHAPLPMQPVPPTTEDLTGIMFGRFTVIGYGIRPSGKWAEAVWVCRCVCGCYMHRKTKAVTNPRNHRDCCDQCRHVEFLKREDLKRQLGYEAFNEWEKANDRREVGS